jgi:hypothetical protein
MAVVTVKSTAITNRDSAPRVLTPSYIERGTVLTSVAIVAIANGDSVNSKYLAVSIPSNARAVSVRLDAPDIGTTTAADVGLYDTTANGGAVVDQDFFGSAVALNAGPYVNLDVTFEAGAAGGSIANAEKRIWEALGLTADPNKYYDVALTLTGAADAAGTVRVAVEWVE